MTACLTLLKIWSLSNSYTVFYFFKVQVIIRQLKLRVPLGNSHTEGGQLCLKILDHLEGCRLGKASLGINTQSYLTKTKPNVMLGNGQFMKRRIASLIPAPVLIGITICQTYKIVILPAERPQNWHKSCKWFIRQSPRWPPCSTASLLLVEPGAATVDHWESNLENQTLEDIQQPLTQALLTWAVQLEE